MPIGNGTYRARAVGEVVLGESAQKNTPFVECYFEITQGENKGGRVRWTGYFSEKTNERTIQSLQIAGWEGENVGEFEDGKLHGLDRNEVDIVVALETYTNDQGEDRVSPRVQWVNRAGGYLNTDAAMNSEAAQSFGERMRGLVLAMKAKRPQPKQDDASFNFGANSAPPADNAPMTTPGKKAF